MLPLKRSERRWYPYHLFPNPFNINRGTIGRVTKKIYIFIAILLILFFSGKTIFVLYLIHTFPPFSLNYKMAEGVRYIL